MTVGGKVFCYYAGWKHHIGVYPIPPLDTELEARIAPLRAAKDLVHFRHAEPLPVELIGRLVVALRTIAGL